MNTTAFTCIGRGHGAPCRPATKEEWVRLRREPWLREMCERIEKGDEQLKHRLPVWTPHCAEFREGHRAIADALCPLSRLMLDFDEKGHTDDIMARLTTDAEKLKTQGITVLLIEESVRRGTHVLVELPQGMSADEAQRLMKEATGFEPDAAVKDVSRCIYMVTEGHTRYVADALFQPSVTLAATGVESSSSEEVSAPRPERERPGGGSLSLTFRGIPYATIIREYWSRTGGVPVEGERNVRLHKLAVCLRSICDNRREVLMAVMPRLGLSEAELKAVVDSACKEPPKGVSKLMSAIVSEEEARMADEQDGTTDAKARRMPAVSVRTLPVGLRESLAGVPASMHMAVLSAVMPLAAAYADGVEVEYCDGNRQHLGLMSIIYGEQASGKSVCKSAVDVWKRQLDEEDALSRRREEEWKERKKGRKANEKVPDDPRVLVRMVPVTVSCSTLLRRLKNAQGHTLYSFGEELDTLRKTNGAGSWSSKYDVYRLSFDRGEWGQDYNSDQAESGVVNVAYNWTMLGTEGALRKCFRQDNIENGLSSRVLVAEMPDSAFARMPKFGRRTPEDEAHIQEAVTRLRSRSGFVDTPRLRRAIEEWVEQKRVEAAKDIDRVKDTYRKRAAVIGFRCGVVYHLLSGAVRESKACLDFALLMADYTLEEQMRAFGDALLSQYVDAREECRRYGANHSVFDRLPPVFTMDDLRSMKQGFCTDAALRKIVSRWANDGWIEKADKMRWKKVAKV